MIPVCPLCANTRRHYDPRAARMGDCPWCGEVERLRVRVAELEAALRLERAQKEPGHQAD